MAQPLYKQLTAVERATFVLQEIRDGKTTYEIADSLGVSVDAVLRMTKNFLRKVAVTEAQEYRAIHMQRLEMMFANLVPQIKQGNAYAVKVAVDVLKRQSQLLGLDAPVAVNVRRLSEEYGEKYGLDAEERKQLFDSIKRELSDQRRSQAGDRDFVRVATDSLMGDLDE